MDAWAPFIPPVPAAPAEPLRLRQFLRAIRTNALTIWPEAAYRQPLTVRPFLGRLNVLLNDPDDIHRVLVDNHANYRRSPASIRILRPITGQGLLLSEGEAWRLQRRTVAPALAPRVLPLLARHVVSAACEAMETLAGRTATPVDLLAAMQGLALGIAGRSMFSLEMNRHGPAMRDLLTEFAHRHARPHMFDMLLPPSVPTLRDIGRRHFQARWMRLMDGVMRERLNQAPPDTPRDLFDLLHAARDPESGAGFTPAQLRDQVTTLILAGHETTAVALFWALTLLAQAPQEQAMLAEEASRIRIDPEAPMVDAGSLPRTRAVINETLRLFPPAFTIVREAIGPDQVGTIKLPARSVIMIAPWVLHRHHAFWRDPAVFDPTRFMPDAASPPRFAFMPFGAGPRVCVGAQFALLEMTLVLALFMQRFQIALADTRPVLPVAVVTTQPDHAPPFLLRAR